LALDPYFLYGASNLGSLLALLGYPLVVERWLKLGEQSQWWAGGYLLLVVLIVGCGITLWLSNGTARSSAAPTGDQLVLGTEDKGISRRQRLLWMGLAAIPVSLMLSVTTYISTDISAIPLLWIIPLSLYLLTFILTFARRPLLPHALMLKIVPVAMVLLTFLLAAKQDETSWLLISIHLLAFFSVALVCHGELARLRPAPHHLTEFYFWLSLGGALGGIFNAIVAPLVFKEVVEYPLTLVLAGLLLLQAAPAPPKPRHERRQVRQQKRRHRQDDGKQKQAESGAGLNLDNPRVLDIIFPVGVLLISVALVKILQEPDQPSSWLARGVMFGLPALLCLVFTPRPVRFSLGLSAVLLASLLYVGGKGTFIHTERTFFGINRVILFNSRTYHALVHGDTLHGAQSLDPSRRQEPLTYYYPNGPLGQLFAEFNGDPSTTAQDAKRNIAVIGLGAGSTACYHQPGQAWTFYEIDPAVVQIARNPSYFTFLEDCTPDARIILGDARLSLKSAKPQEYDLMILDAYSSDAIPIHLITREALQLYLDKLAPGGVLAFHITNRHLDLKTVLGNLALDAHLTYRAKDDLDLDPYDGNRGKMPAQWAVLARSPDDLGALADDPLWIVPTIRPDTSVWTDDFNSLLSVFIWRR
jgi:SAM-dependent methyltransferase